MSDGHFVKTHYKDMMNISSSEKGENEERLFSSKFSPGFLVLQSNRAMILSILINL